MHAALLGAYYSDAFVAFFSKLHFENFPGGRSGGRVHFFGALSLTQPH
jgi:hypothetical protein